MTTDKKTLAKCAEWHLGEYHRHRNYRLFLVKNHFGPPYPKKHETLHLKFYEACRAAIR